MRILAVDDERYALESLTDELKKAFIDAEIYAEKDALEAERCAAETAEAGKVIDYAFLDIQLRGMNGLELAWRIKRIQPQAQIFFCTAYNRARSGNNGEGQKGYLLKPVKAIDIQNAIAEKYGEGENALTEKKNADVSECRIRVQTFGTFELFIDGKKMTFDRKKAKELLAYLVDCCGAYVTYEKLAEILWNNRPYDRKMKRITTATISSLRNSLKTEGITDILLKSGKKLAIDIKKISCDAYDFSAWRMDAVNSFYGEYMTGYSWAEFIVNKFI